MSLRSKAMYLLSLVASLLSLPVYAVFRLAGRIWWNRVIALTYDLFSKYYDSFVKLLPGYENASTHALGSIRFSKDMTVLDVACRTGLLTLKVAGKVKDIIGIDISKGQLLRLKHKLAAYTANVHIVRGDAEMLPFKDDSFGVVLSQGALSEIALPRAVIREMARVLKRGGSLAIVTYGKRGIIGLVNPWAFRPVDVENDFLEEGLHVKRLSWLEPHYILLVGAKR